MHERGSGYETLVLLTIALIVTVEVTLVIVVLVSITLVFTSVLILVFTIVLRAGQHICAFVRPDGEPRFKFALAGQAGQ